MLSRFSIIHSPISCSKVLPFNNWGLFTFSMPSLEHVDQTSSFDTATGIAMIWVESVELLYFVVRGFLFIALKRQLACDSLFILLEFWPVFNYHFQATFFERQNKYAAQWQFNCLRSQRLLYILVPSFKYRLASKNLPWNGDLLSIIVAVYTCCCQVQIHAYCCQ